MNADAEEQEDELVALQSIFDSEEFVRNESKAAGEIRASAELPAGFTVVLKEGETVRQYEISFLPPLVLTFELPENYPSSSPPSFTLTCSWLTHTQVISSSSHWSQYWVIECTGSTEVLQVCLRLLPQLSALAAQLSDLYRATRGAVVLFSWVQFLREDALKFLDIHNLLELRSDQHSAQDTQSAEPTIPAGQDDALNEDDVSASSSSDPLDPTGQGASLMAACPTEPPQNKDHMRSDLTPSQILLSQILIFDADQKQRVFASTVFDCSVCFMSLLGSECVQLLDCGHIFCQACLAEFCKIQIKEGTVRGVTCLQEDCTATPTPAQVRTLVGEELFSRYDHLLLQSTLASMSDVVYCPRRSCGSAVILDKSSTVAVCSVCGFAFCVKCRKTYHGKEDCPTPSRYVNLPQSYEGRKALVEDYKGASRRRRFLLEKRYGSSLKAFTVEEI
ncbi:hypothetical protein Q5P01_015661 [Channa striata]|uniref:RBR-type E3 ubiquitin transferase n=1 Tax=Channa striata TaxID=64152 RepID=A0AA88MF46_CHASR|nr:hypothetical protein Q5P01_015661 [Channa striata]